MMGLSNYFSLSVVFLSFVLSFFLDVEIDDRQLVGSHERTNGLQKRLKEKRPPVFLFLFYFKF